MERCTEIDYTIRGVALPCFKSTQLVSYDDLSIRI
jgi:hypothetical protein